MARSGFSVLSHLAALVAGGAAVWLLLGRGGSDGGADPAGHLVTLERELADARRDAGDWQSVATSERERRELAEGDLERLRRAVAEPASPAPSDADLTPSDEGEPVAPSAWDMIRLRSEMQRLGLAGRRMARVPLFAAVVEATRANGDAGSQLLVDILSEPALPAGLHTAAMLVAEQLGERRAVEPLLKRMSTLTDAQDRRLTLRVLATLPGQDQVPMLFSVWQQDTVDPRYRLMAIHGLARRGHEEGIRVVRGESKKSTAPLRARAMESLHSFVREHDYERVDLIDAFGVALLSADGDAQRRLALLVLEGYWHPDCVPYLTQFGENASLPEELTTRALRAAGAIQRGEPRPVDAGLSRDQASPSPIARESDDE